ncbi:MAG: hypothetical protein J2P50_20200 [Hyphomicrobiaceae bacterium]|nr:hypothetical protein [Hyphomicrobiaceae bacterium]
MITASVALNPPVRATVTFASLSDSPLGRPVALRQDVLPPADLEERRWQLEWERRNVED